MQRDLGSTFHIVIFFYLNTQQNHLLVFMFNDKMQRQREVRERFGEYFEQWMLQLETNLQLLLSVGRDSSHEEEQRSLVSKATNLYKEYYTVKWEAAHNDVLGFFSQPWLTPLENSHAWVTGWKPSMFFRLIYKLRESTTQDCPLPNFGSLTDEQMEKIDQLKARTSQEEGKVEMDMERQQVSLAERRMVELAKMSRQEKCVEVKGLVEVAINTLLVSLERIMKTADCVRLKALRDILHVLTPLQSVDFLAAALMVHIQLRNWGKRRNYSCAV